MNVLTFVMVMLMLLTTLTYSRLESFRSSQAAFHAYSAFFAEEERAPFNEAMEEKYDEMKVVEGGGAEGAKAAQASRGFNLSVLLKPKENPERYQAYASLFKTLVQQLYIDVPYLKELEQTRPGYMEEFVEALADQKVKKLSDLNFSDPELNRLCRLFTKRGAALAKILTLRPQKDIRVYLASPELLLAIFQDPDSVKEILRKREELYKEVKGGQTNEIASTQFEAFVKSYPTPLHPFLNTQVSKTNPNR